MTSPKPFVLILITCPHREARSYCRKWFSPPALATLSMGTKASAPCARKCVAGECPWFPHGSPSWCAALAHRRTPSWRATPRRRHRYSLSWCAARAHQRSSRYVFLDALWERPHNSNIIRFTGVQEGRIDDKLLLLDFLLVFQDIDHLPLLGREKWQTVATFLLRPASRSAHILHFIFSFLQHGDVKLDCSVLKNSTKKEQPCSTQFQTQCLARMREPWIVQAREFCGKGGRAFCQQGTDIPSTVWGPGMITLFLLDSVVCRFVQLIFQQGCYTQEVSR